MRNNHQPPGILAVCAASLIFWSCFGDLPHENPLDPESPLFVSTGNVRATVTTYYQPYRPVRGVTVELWPGDWTAATDTAGSSLLRNVTVGEYWIIARHRDYAPDSTRITVEQGVLHRLSFQLDALPQVRQFSGRTFHAANWPPLQDDYFALFDAEIEDPDGPADLATVLLENTTIGSIDTMAATSQAGVYSSRMLSADLPEGNLHSILGHKLHCIPVDRLGNSPDPKELIIFRVIDSSPQAAAPQDTVMSDSRPTLSWLSIDLAFPFTFSVRVERFLAGTYSVAWEREGIARQTMSVHVDRPLAAGDYRWTVSVVDEFGNTSISRPAGFSIN